MFGWGIFGWSGGGGGGSIAGLNALLAPAVQWLFSHTEPDEVDD